MEECATALLDGPRKPGYCFTKLGGLSQREERHLRMAYNYTTASPPYFFCAVVAPMKSIGLLSRGLWVQVPPAALRFAQYKHFSLFFLNLVCSAKASMHRNVCGVSSDESGLGRWPIAVLPCARAPHPDHCEAAAQIGRAPGCKPGD